MTQTKVKDGLSRSHRGWRSKEWHNQHRADLRFEQKRKARALLDKVYHPRSES